jgi:excisionase family DNA binding protein
MDFQEASARSSLGAGLSAVDTVRDRIREIAGAKPLLSAAQVAIVLGVSPVTVYRLMESGKLKFVKMNGRLRRISAVTLERFLCGD